MYDNNVTIRQQQSRRCFPMTGMMKTSCVLMQALLLMLSGLTSASTLADSELHNLNAVEVFKPGTTDTLAVKQTKQGLYQHPFSIGGFMVPTSPLAGCPLCDSSVYSYCSHKLIHDSCCCDFPGAAAYQKPPQCAHYDCRLLYAKSCYEHSLIKNCCCNNPY